jgi:hypothetical protein
MADLLLGELLGPALLPPSVERRLRRLRFTDLSPADGRLIAQRTAWNSGCLPVWRHLIDEKSASVSVGPDASALTPREAILLTAADELYTQRCLTESTWGEMDLTTSQRGELYYLVGGCAMAAMLTNSFSRTIADQAVTTPRVRDGLPLHDPNWSLPDQPRLPAVASYREIGPLGSAMSRILGFVSGCGRMTDFDLLSRARRTFASSLPIFLRISGPAAVGRANGELITLRACWNVGSEYHWQHHSRAARFFGVTPEEIDRVRLGPSASGWSPRRALALQVADELHERRYITDETWSAAVAELGPSAIAEIALTVGLYELMWMGIGSTGVRFEEGSWERGMGRVVSALMCSGVGSPMWAALDSAGIYRARQDQAWWNEMTAAPADAS